MYQTTYLASPLRKEHMNAITAPVAAPTEPAIPCIVTPAIINLAGAELRRIVGAELAAPFARAPRRHARRAAGAAGQPVDALLGRPGAGSAHDTRPVGDGRRGADGGVGPDARRLHRLVRVDGGSAGAHTVTPHYRIADTSPPVATWVQVYWWGENRWITARFDGVNWRDELGRIVQGPIIYWRKQQ